MYMYILICIYIYNFGTMYSVFTSNAGYKPKRLQFITLITSALYSGMETLNLGVIDTRTFDSCILKKLRCMLMGKGYTFDDKNDTRNKWNNGKVWKHWKVIPTALEILIRRVKW